MLGTIVADDKGWVIETMMPMDSEPVLLISRYRVVVMDGRPTREREDCRYRNQIWEGSTFRAGTDNQFPESMDKLPIKRPRGMKVYRDGQWKRN